MTPAIIGRRRLLAGGAAAGLAVLTGCEVSGTSGGATPSRAGAAVPGGTAALPRSSSPSTSASPASPTPAATPAPAAAARVDAPRLTERLERYLAGRGGSLGLELVDLRRGEAFAYEAQEAYCYSTVKVLILTTLLRRLRDDDAELEGRQRLLAERMITRSDNSAAETLLADVGRAEVKRVAGLVGMERTTIDSGWWGHWRTVPGDLNLMVDAVLSSDRVLDGARRTVARFLMADVVPEQRWGVFAPESRRVHVAAKNGWGPLPDGFRLNSAGWVSGNDREYVLSILSTSPAGFRHGRRTISEVAELCHDAVGEGLA